MAEVDTYQDWRNASLEASWNRFSDTNITNKDVVDFGCGAGHLTRMLAATRSARSHTGVELDAVVLTRAKTMLQAMRPLPQMPVQFVAGSVDGMPLQDHSADTILAFDCLEHVMDPVSILKDWHRVLRPGGKALIEWFPYAGPYGPHMEALIPIPWAHFLFGQRAMFETAERLYDDPAFQPRHWDMDDQGNKLPNKWRQWRSFAEQAYINELSTSHFKRMAQDSGFSIVRFDRHGLFSTKKQIAPLTKFAAKLPVVGDLLTSHVLIELQRR